MEDEKTAVELRIINGLDYITVRLRVVSVFDSGKEAVQKGDGGETETVRFGIISGGGYICPALYPAGVIPISG